MAKLNTFKKYFITVSLFFLLCLTVIILIVSFLINNFLSKDRFKSLTVSCDAVSGYVIHAYNEENFNEDLHSIANVISGMDDNMIVVANVSGEIIACSCSDFDDDKACSHSIEAVSSNTLKKLSSGEINEVGRFDGKLSEMHFIVGRQITVVDNTTVGYVFVLSPASTLTEFYGELFKLYAFAAVIPIIVLFFAMYAITYRWVKPLKLMSQASQAMAKGDFSRRIPVLSNDEIGQLSDSFNKMTDSLVELENMRRSFIANVSHELKTPMTTIGGFIDGIVDGTIEPKKHDYYLKIVSDEVKRLSRLVEGMLSLSKLEAGETKLKLSRFDFRDLLFNVVISQEQRIESKSLTINGLDGIESTTVYADKDLLHQVVYNLCDNAIKFTNESGEITFSVKKENNFVVFIVRNTGVGIPQSDLPRIFDRFYKGDKARSANKDSTGLGLYLVKTIIELHGGTTFVKSHENVFTEFGIRLPLK